MRVIESTIPRRTIARLDTMNRHGMLLALVAIYAATFRLAVLDRPFDYDAEGSGCLNGVLARSYLRFDWAQTRGMPVLSLDPARATPIVFYPDHPPLVPLLIVPFYKAFGVGPWQTRLPIALTTIGAILVLYGLVALVATRRTALIAAALFAATPMTLYFGGFADVVGMPLILFTLVTVFAYLRFQRAPGFRTFAALAVAFAVAGFCDWPAYVVAPIVAGHFIATRRRSEWPWIVLFGMVACVWFLAVYTYITLATGSPWTWMADLFARRSALVGVRTYTGREWLTAAASFNTTYHTVPLMIAAAIGIAASRFRRGSESGATVALLLLAWAALYAFIGAKALYNHEWAWCVFTPGLAVAAALLLDRVPGIAAAGAVVAFAIWTTASSFASLYPAPQNWAFTPMQMAAAIELAAPGPRDVALIVGDEAPAQLWFYADRLTRGNIWTVDDFERRLNDDTVDLMFNFDEQPWKERATGLVFPKIWRGGFGNLYDYLGARYPRVPLPPALADMFDVFDVRTERSPAPSP